MRGSGADTLDKRTTPLTPEQTACVTRSFAQVQPIAAQAGAMFYARLFELDPALRPLFKDDMTAQADKLMATLGFAIGNLNKPEALLPAVRALGVRHQGYGVLPSHYATVGEALLWTLRQGLGDAFTPAVEDGWVATIALVTETMQSAATA